MSSPHKSPPGTTNRTRGGEAFLPAQVDGGIANMLQSITRAASLSPRENPIPFRPESPGISGTVGREGASKTAEDDRGIAEMVRSITRAISLAAPEKLAPLRPEKTGSHAASEMAADDASAAALSAKLIAHFEGLSLDAYPDPKTKNDPVKKGEPITIGFGTTRYPEGGKVKMGDKVTPEDAMSYLTKHIENKILPKMQRISGWEKMSFSRKAALISFAYNLGADFYGSKNFKSITKVLKKQEWKDIPKILFKYRNPGSNVEEGLKKRRLLEGAVWDGASLALLPPPPLIDKNPKPKPPKYKPRVQPPKHAPHAQPLKQAPKQLLKQAPQHAPPVSNNRLG